MSDDLLELAMSMRWDVQQLIFNMRALCEGDDLLMNELDKADHYFQETYRPC